jgi:hypothetical protein
MRRLDLALAALERRAEERRRGHLARAAELHEDERARLSLELDAARARERALETVAAEASAALGRAAAEVKAALSAEEG